MFSFADFFAGIGGFRIAAERCGGKCVFSCEIDKTAQAIYKKNFGDLPYLDIRILSEMETPDFDILFAGFPCQPFSIAGLKEGFKDPKNGDLFFHILRILVSKQPKAFVLENVKNFLQIDAGQTFQLVYSLLDKAGYNVFYKVLNSKYFGVAQNRERLFIVGIHKDFNSSFQFPKEKKTNIVLEDILDNANNVEPHLFYVGDFILTKKNPDKRVYKPYRIGIVNKGRQGERIYSVKGLSVTISHSTGGVFPKTGGYLTPQGIRTLTINEVKKLFDFPPSFSFDGLSYSKAISLLGNSVVVNLVEEIIKNMYKALFLKSNSEKKSMLYNYKSVPLAY